MSALLTLLQDEDLKIASLAMEQLLKLGRVTDETIAEHQESHDPRLRHRIHQLSSIVTRRQQRVEFIKSASRESVSLWSGVLQVNRLYDPRCELGRVTGVLDEMFQRLRRAPTTTSRVAALMRDLQFVVPDDDLLDVDLFLIQRVMETRYGSPAILCALAQHVGHELGWGFTVVLHKGRYCLIDRHNLLVDPAQGWRIQKLKASERIHPCSRKDVLLGVLAQLFLIALIEGQLRGLHYFGDLLTALDGGSMDVLPYPLGDDA